VIFDFGLPIFDLLDWRKVVSLALK
jgi:hypothetical protein